MLMESNYYSYQPKDNRSNVVVGAAVALVVGLVVCVGVSSPSTSLFTLRPVQTSASIAPVSSAKGTIATVQTVAATRQVSRSGLSSAKVDVAKMEGVNADAGDRQTGLGLPLVLASLSMVLLGMASWLVRPQRQQAMAAMGGVRSSALQAAATGTPAPELKVVGPVKDMLTPLGYYEAYELVVVLSPRLSDLEKEDRLASLEALFTQNKCKKVEKLDRGRRLLSYPIQRSIEASIVLYTFKGPRSMPKLINDWFVGPGVNSDGNVFRCFLTKQRRAKKETAMKGQGEDDMPMWTV